MAGELTIEEKLEITSAALKDLHTQLYKQELHDRANAITNVERTAALKAAIRRLQDHYDTLTAERSSPSNPSPQEAAR